MTDLNHPSEARTLRRGTVAQIATTVFIGIPMTLGLITAVAVFCTFEYAKYKFFFQAPRSPKPTAQAASSEAFTASLTKMAEIHGSTPTLNPAPKLDVHEAVIRDDGSSVSSRLP